MNSGYPKISPAPNWVSIFTLRDDLSPPGYIETFLEIQEHPYVKPGGRQRGKSKGEKEKEKTRAQ
ncbi:MAG: hypothetical protein EBY66_00595 [Candidatus Fonsibacter lacus]|nr:hypothetical protein [Candidatus Fonsibacter lacus]